MKELWSELDTPTVAPGEQRSDLNILIPQLPLLQIRGYLQLPAGKTLEAPLTIALTSITQDGTSSVFPIAKTLASGLSFSLEKVPAGRYRLRAYSFPRAGGAQIAGGTFIRPGGVVRPVGETLWDERDLVVADQDLNSISLTLREGATISGLVAPPHGGANPFVTIERGDGYDVGPIPITPLSEGRTFRTVPLPPGPYVLEVVNGGFSAESGASAPGRIRHQVVLGTQDIAGLTLSGSSDAARLRGRVSLPSGGPCRRCSVYVFPQSRLWWEGYGSRSTNVLESRTDEEGNYSIDPLPADDYYAHTAVIPDPNWRLSSSLAVLALTSTRVRVPANSIATLDLRASPR